MNWFSETTTMLCAKHGEVEILTPMPGSPPICPKCSEDDRERERMNWEGLKPIRDQLDRIEAALTRLLLR